MILMQLLVEKCWNKEVGELKYCRNLKIAMFFGEGEIIIFLKVWRYRFIILVNRC